MAAGGPRTEAVPNGARRGAPLWEGQVNTCASIPAAPVDAAASVKTGELRTVACCGKNGQREGTFAMGGAPDGTNVSCATLCIDSAH